MSFQELQSNTALKASLNRDFDANGVAVGLLASSRRTYLSVFGQNQLLRWRVF